MGKQIAFHMLEEDCRIFVDFVQQRDPVIVIRWSTTSPEVRAIRSPWQKAGWYCLWNQSVFASLKREFIAESKRGPYYRVDSSVPVTEFSYPGPVIESWNGRPGILQGRLWTGFPGTNDKFEKWYNALIRWIRKNFVRNPVPHLGGYIGPSAYESYKQGVLLLPQFAPPATSQWLSWVEAQDQHRAVFSK